MGFLLNCYKDCSLERVVCKVTDGLMQRDICFFKQTQLATTLTCSFLRIMGRLGALCAILILMFQDVKASKDDCPTSRCRPEGPEIRFPFRRRDQPQHCGYPGFEVTCKGNETVLKLPSLGEFSLTSISYPTQTLLLDWKNCPAAILLNLDVSGSPFHFYSNYDGGIWSQPEDYTLINCSTGDLIEGTLYMSMRPSYSHEIQCLSDITSHIFAVPSSFNLADLPRSCLSVKLISLTMLYKYFLLDDIEPGVAPPLKWDWPECVGCEASGGNCQMSDIRSHETTCLYRNNLLSNNRRGHLKWYLILVATIGTLVLVAIVTTILYHFWLSKQKAEKENQLKVEKFLENYKVLKPTRYSYADIKRITNQFKTKLGEGGFGTVFKGLLPNGIRVAVKILKRCVGNNGEEFVNEVGTIGRIHHVNVVRLLGFCADGFKRALVYEFMPNESLAKFIFSVNGRISSLGWEKLHSIAIGIARGIEYLHQGCDQRILHFDIKPHNILLDNNFIPKVSDFGLAKLCSKDRSIVSMTAARGTVGYIAPEVFSRNFGNVSYKSDVYSFGMLLLEMVGGRKNIDATVVNISQVYFPEWIYNRVSQGEELELQIFEEEEAIIAKKLTIVALWCIQWYPVDRPSMKSVLQMLEGSSENLRMPPNPFTSAVPPNTAAALSDGPIFSNLPAIPEAYSVLEID